MNCKLQLTIPILVFEWTLKHLTVVVLLPLMIFHFVCVWKKWNNHVLTYQPFWLKDCWGYCHHSHLSLHILCWSRLTHCGHVTHICVGKLTIIVSDNGLSPGRRQAIIWTNAEILLIEPLETNFSEILIGIEISSFKKMCLKMSSAKWRPFFSASMC